MAAEARALDAEARRLQAHVAGLYLRTRILTADAVRLVVEVHDAAILSLDRALAAIYARSETSRGGSAPPDAGQHVSRALRDLCELDLFLDFQRAPELSADLSSIYEHLQTILAEECADPSRSAIVQVLRHLRALRETWTIVRRRSR